MAIASIRGKQLHEGVSSLRSSKDLTFHFVSVLSNNEGLSAIWASLNFWFHIENLRDLGHTRKKNKGMDKQYERRTANSTDIRLHIYIPYPYRMYLLLGCR